VDELLGWPITLSATAMSTAVLCSVVVGVVAGAYPAWRASRLDPITALRRE
jgi:ABC-type antimicrobial peptide transport system permease subunit